MICVKKEKEHQKLPQKQTFFALGLFLVIVLIMNRSRKSIEKTAAEIAAVF